MRRLEDLTDPYAATARFAKKDAERSAQLAKLIRGPVIRPRVTLRPREPRPPGAVRFGCYLPTDLLDEAEAEAKRLGLTLSKLMQRAWVLARGQVKP